MAKYSAFLYLPNKRDRIWAIERRGEQQRRQERWRPQESQAHAEHDQDGRKDQRREQELRVPDGVL